MKILTLHFKNINSLEGENQVDFQQAPFSETGVFAITGPNGSGKSSILDVITLGLYGETFRFDRPADFVMTQHTAESFAVVEFTVDGESYKSGWFVERAEGDANRELMSPQMQLVRLSDEQVLADTPQQVSRKMLEITGMSFRNFTRSIMLAQGDFSAFLNALDNERMDILEKIISADIYAEYKKDVLDKAISAQKEMEFLRQQLLTIQVMPPEKQEANEQDLFDFKEQLIELQEEQNTLTQQQTLLSNISVINKQITEQEGYLVTLQQKIADNQRGLEQINLAKDLLIFKEDIAAIANKNNLIQQAKEDLDALKSELKFLREQVAHVDVAPESLAKQSFSEQQKTLENIRLQLNQLILNRQTEIDHWQSLSEQSAQKESAFTHVSAWLDEHQLDEALLTELPEIGKLKKLRAEVIDLNKKVKSYSKQTKKTSTALQNNTSALAKQQARQVESKTQIESDEKELLELLQGNTLEYLESLKQDQQERVKDFQTLYNIGLKHEKLSGRSGLLSWFKPKETPEYDADELTLALEKLQQDFKREENIRASLETAITYEALLKKLTPDRVHLVHGKPCALCGALQHPYAKFPPVISNSKQALIDQKAKMRELKEDISQVTFKINLAHKNAANNKVKQTQSSQLRAEWLSQVNRLNCASKELTINNISLMKELLLQANEELTELVKLIANVTVKQTAIEKNKTLIAKGVVTIEQLLANKEQLGSGTESVSQEQIDLEAALASAQAQETELVAKVTAQLALFGEKMPTKGQEDALFDKLNTRRQEYHTYSFRHKSLIEERVALEEKQITCQQETSRLNEQIELFTTQLQAQEAIGLHLGLIEKQKLIAEREQVLVGLDVDLAQLQKVIQEKIASTSFTSLQEISNVLDIMENQADIERQQADLAQQLSVKTQEIKALQAELDAIYAATTNTLSNSLELEQALKSHKEKLTITRMEVEHLERILDEQAQNQAAYEEVAERLQQLEVDAKVYIADAALINVENGMAFRRRVQNQLADKLLSQTNALLEKISGRYYLRQAYSELGLALEVEDTYQANVRRLPKTLSGGESFIVSLALALGLSELANNGRSVDSLFLDEGFGNLDADALYTVISTLENLHTHGKTVGVISHVEAVHKRFKAQLQIVKKSNGLAAIKQAS